MRKVIFIVLAIGCFQHLIRDYLQDRGVKNWYTTFAHPKFISDTSLNNHIGMIIFFILGIGFLYLALRKPSKNET
jgi:putative Mn2+ efflux pump MntP